MAYKKADIEAAIEQSNGIIADVVRILGCDYKSWYNFVDKWPELEDKLEAAGRQSLSVIENVVIAAARNGDLPTARWVLDRRDPRYSSKANVAVSVVPEQKTAYDGQGPLPDDIMAAMRTLGGITQCEGDDDGTLDQP